MKEENEIGFLNEKAETLLQLAKEKSLDENYLFCTTYNRYITQIRLLHTLIDEYNKTDTLISKEYVKGRENLTANPLITKINQTIDSANKTANLIVNMLTKVKGLEATRININELEFFGSPIDVINALGSIEDKRRISKMNKKEIDELSNQLIDEYKQEREFDL